MHGQPRRENENGGRVTKVYYDVMLVNLLAGPSFQFLPWPKILIKIVRCAMKSRSWLTHFESLKLAVKKAEKKKSLPDLNSFEFYWHQERNVKPLTKKVIFQQFSIVLFYLCVATLQSQFNIFTLYVNQNASKLIGYKAYFCMKSFFCNKNKNKYSFLKIISIFFLLWTA